MDAIDLLYGYLDALEQEPSPSGETWSVRIAAGELNHMPDLQVQAARRDLEGFVAQHEPLLAAVLADPGVCGLGSGGLGDLLWRERQGSAPGPTTVADVRHPSHQRQLRAAVAAWGLHRGGPYEEEGQLMYGWPNAIREAQLRQAQAASRRLKSPIAR